jgi:hypothetical protein
MTSRALWSGILITAGLLGITGAWQQRERLAELRHQRLALLTATTASPTDTNTPAPAAPQAAPEQVPPVSPELLRLRREVSELSARVRALGTLSNENSRLRTQAANPKTGAALPPGYLRANQAQRVGFSSPDDTLQTFLWAARNRDLDCFTQCLTPEKAAMFEQMIQQTGDTNSVFEGTGAMVGFLIRDRHTEPDGSVELMVEVVPGQPPDPIHLRQVNGGWRMTMR